MRIVKRIATTVIAVVLMIPATLIAQELPRPMPFSPALFSHDELEQLAAPIALYPDPLLAQVLMAATYPVEVGQAAQFVQANPSLTEGRLGEALRYQNWDDSVKALVAFPQVLAMMGGRLDWTQRLGDAFVAQQQDLMDAVQVLRARAQAQGTLTSSPQQVVTVQAPYIYIQPASPQVIYVPVYNPLIVYGRWPYPAHQPYYYRPAGWPVAPGFFGFGGGTFVGFGLWGTCDWHRHGVFVDVTRYRRFTEVVNVQGRRGEIEHGRIGPRERDRLVWQHDVRHRENVEIRHTSAPQPVAAPRQAVVPSREPIRSRVEQPRVEPPRGVQPLAEQPRADHPRAEQPRAEQPRGPDQGRPQPARGGPEATRPSVQPATRPEPSRPNPGDSPHAQVRVQASPALLPTPRREPGEPSHANRVSGAPPSPSVRNAPVASVANGVIR